MNLTQMKHCPRIPEDCVVDCGEEEGCKMWTWTRGKCYLMSGRVWSKEADPGSVSGGHHCLQNPMIGETLQLVLNI